VPANSSSGRDPRRASAQKTVRSSSGASRSGSARPAASRSGSARPAASRSGAARPQGSKSSGSRPAQNRRPAPRKKKRTQPRFFIILAILAILIVALVLIFGGKGGNDVVYPQPTPEPAVNNSGMSNATVSSKTEDSTGETAASQEANYSTLSEWLNNEDAVGNAPAVDLVQVEDLSINPNLPGEWMNILLLGSDERTLSENSRTDAMLICSINPNTGEVKLTSLMRDTAVKFTDLGKYNGTYRINSANYFGGPDYAIKTINECLDMNIQYYVMVNFFGFQKIAQALGGIEMDITETEMEQINRNAVDQAWTAYYAGIDESDQINEYLTTYGPNTHLNGRQTLAYARIRHTDSDFTRAERQRKVLIKLLEKLKTKSAAELVILAGGMFEYISTNMDINAILPIATRVVESGVSNVETLRLPENDTYKLERRNEQEMFYDVDWDTNSRVLYNFIYE